MVQRRSCERIAKALKMPETAQPDISKHDKKAVKKVPTKTVLSVNGKRRGRPPKNSCVDAPQENRPVIEDNDVSSEEEWDEPSYITDHDEYFPSIPRLPDNKGKFGYELTEDQIDNVNDIARCISESGHVIISAEAGTGKTTTVSYYLGCMRDKYKRCIVVCPDGSPGIVEMWQRSLDITGAPSDAVIRYGTLRSGKSSRNPDRVLSHGLLRKVDGDTGDVEFFPTDKLEQWAEEGLAVVFDESHNGNNNSMQAMAMLALLQPVFANKEKCAVFLVSYTVCYNAASIPNILAYLGYADDPMLLAIHENKLYASVYNDCINRIKEKYPKSAAMLDVKSYASFVKRTKRGSTIDRKAMGEHLLLAFDNFIRKDIACAMKKLDLPCGKEVKNVFYMPMDEDRAAAEKLILNLSSAGLVLDDNGNSGGKNRESILHDLETIRIKAALNLEILPMLKSTKNDKLVIMVKHITSVNYVRDFLSKEGFAVLIVTGEHTPSKSERTAIVSKFQQHDNEYRILIGTSQILSVGCSLDDTHGDYKRWLYIGPSFRFNDMVQSINRVYRRSTKSRPTIIFIYLDGSVKESKMLLNMLKKEKIMKKTTAISMLEDMPLLPTEIECHIHATGQIYTNFNNLEMLTN